MTNFQPKWASPPGDTINDVLQKREIALDDLTTSLGLSQKQMTDLLRGRIAIDKRLAHQLEQITDITATFWLVRESQYREDLARVAHEQEARIKQDWTKLLPVRDMARFGWIKPTENLEERFAACLNFFGVADLNEWHDRYRRVQDVVAFRTSGSFESQPGAVAAWIRQGEIEAARVETRRWNAAKFEKILPTIRKLTKKKDPRVFLPELIRLCADCGVAIVIARAPEGCRASGATKFLSADKALVMLSFRHRTDDHFWFTFFHEAGHLLLHGTGALFVEDPNLVTTHEEEEANQFAMDILVPDEFRAEMLDLPKDPKAITKFAVRVGVSRGIIVGQLQHHRRIAHKDLNFMKARYAWATP